MADAPIRRLSCKYQNAATKAYSAGTLTLDPTRVCWSSDDDQQEIVVLLPNITNQQRAKGKPFLRLVTSAKAHVFEFDSELDRDSMVEAVSKAQAAQQAASMASSPSVGLSLHDKKQLLADDKDLAELYSQMVGSANGQPGVLTEDEFWQGVVSRQGGLQATGSTPASSRAVSTITGGGQPAQRTGLGNRMVVVEGEVDGRQQMGKGKLSVTVTPQMIVQIFAERPHVKRAFSKNVPNNMSEQEFWNRFVKHEVAKEVRRKRMLSGSSVEDVPDDFGELFSANSSSAAEQRRQRGKLACVNPAINLASQMDDNPALQGHGLTHDSCRESNVVAGQGVVNMKIAGDLVHDINRHAEVVLGGVDAMQALAAQRAEAAAAAHPAKDGGRPTQNCRVTLDDLMVQAVEEAEMLSISDPRRYFDRMQGDPEPVLKSDFVKEEWKPDLKLGPSSYSSYGRGDEEHGVLQSLKQIDPYSLNPDPMSSEVAYKTMYECFSGHGPPKPGGHGPTADSLATLVRSPADVLPPVLLSMIRSSALAINELCRHFWACIPAPITPARQNKLERLATALNSKYEEVERMVSAAQGPERAYIRQLLRPPRDMLEAALGRYDNEKAASAL